MLKSKNQIETNKYELEIEVSPEAFEEALQKAYLKNKSKITVAGFRPGKAPRKVIEKEYGKACFFEDAANELYGPAVEEAVKEAELELVTTPDVEITEISKEIGIKMKATCTVKPTIEIKDYLGIKATKTLHPVTEHEVEHEIGHMLEKNERTISIDSRPCEMGDDVVIDYEGFKDGVPFDGGKDEGFTLSLGSGQFIPGFEEQVVGHSVDEEFEINVKFPEEYHSAELAGADAVFKIKLHEIQKKELPEFDDDFAKDTSDFDTAEELRADVKKQIEEHMAEHAQAEAEDAVMDALIEKIEGEIPEVMYENKVNEMFDQLSARLQQQGIPLDLYLQYTGMTEESLRETYKEPAEKQVKLRLALEKIAEIEKIEVTDEDVEKEYADIASYYEMPVDTVKQYIPVADIKADASVGKAAELVKDSAVIETVTAEADDDDEHIHNHLSH